MKTKLKEARFSVKIGNLGEKMLSQAGIFITTAMG
jgi:hypothetical protein